MTLLERRDFDTSLPDIDAAPADLGRLVRIVRRPAVDQRELVDTARLDPVVGLKRDS